MAFNDNNYDPYASPSGYGQQDPYGQQNQYSMQNQYGQGNEVMNQLQNSAQFQQGMFNTQAPYGQNSQFNQGVGAQYNQGYGQFNQMNGGYDQGGYNSNPYANQGSSSLGGLITAEAMNSVLVKSFMFMFIALMITGITAMIVASSESMIQMLYGQGSGPIIAVLILEFALVMICSATLKQNNPVLSGTLFLLYSIVNGITFSVIFLVFQISSIASIFFVTALIFAIMSLYGAVTKKDLSSWGSILLIGLFGIIIASVVNFFIGSSMVDTVVCVIGVALFVAFTAYDVNKIKKLSQMNTGLSTTVLGLFGALNLYLDFINLFLKLLRLFGKRR